MLQAWIHEYIRGINSGGDKNDDDSRDGNDDGDRETLVQVTP